MMARMSAATEGKLLLASDLRRAVANFGVRRLAGLFGAPIPTHRTSPHSHTLDVAAWSRNILQHETYPGARIPSHLGLHQQPPLAKAVVPQPTADSSPSCFPACSAWQLGEIATAQTEKRRHYTASQAHDARGAQVLNATICGH